MTVFEIIGIFALRMDKGMIKLEGMQFRCCHGCFDWEKTTPQDFVVDVELACDLEKAVGSDCLEDTVDYGAVFDAVSSEMSIPSNLLEHLCGRIASRIVSLSPIIEEVRVTVSKMNPPVNGRAVRSAVTISKSRNGR